LEVKKETLDAVGVLIDDKVLQLKAELENRVDKIMN
jgi:hypothetical protein